ncbi:MAG: type II toxin-antitoxin system VapC family toxin [Terracidiphilus sp.]|jgi:predicted nucleic acid-binding protein
MAWDRKAILLDTSVLIDLLHGRKEPAALIRDLILSGSVLATSSVNIAELYAGMRKGEEAATEALISGLECLPLTPEIAKKAGNITAARRRLGKTHSLDDMMIAATVIEYGYTLLTDNRKDFEIPDIELFPA